MLLVVDDVVEGKHHIGLAELGELACDGGAQKCRRPATRQLNIPAIEESNESNQKHTAAPKASYM